MCCVCRGGAHQPPPAPSQPSQGAEGPPAAMGPPRFPSLAHGQGRGSPACLRGDITGLWGQGSLLSTAPQGLCWGWGSSRGLAHCCCPHGAALGTGTGHTGSPSLAAWPCQQQRPQISAPPSPWAPPQTSPSWMNPGRGHELSLPQLGSTGDGAAMAPVTLAGVSLYPLTPAACTVGVLAGTGCGAGGDHGTRRAAPSPCLQGPRGALVTSTLALPSGTVPRPPRSPPTSATTCRAGTGPGAGGARSRVTPPPPPTALPRSRWGVRGAIYSGGTHR